MQHEVTRSSAQTGGAVAAPGTVAAAPLPTRRLGKTGEEVPILGLGTAPAGFGMPDDEARALFHYAIDRGITYLDTAPGYDRAHTQLAPVLRERRGEVFLVTKTAADTADEALSILQKGLADMQIERADLVYVHSAGDRDPDRVLAPDGALAGLRQAQRDGLTRFIGFSAHNRPLRAAQLLEQAEVDVVMLALNFADRFTYGFDQKVLPLARARDVGVAAMKVFGGAPGMKYEQPVTSAMQAAGTYDHALALRYALDLPGVSTAVVGMYNRDEMEQDIAWALQAAPLSPAEAEQLEADGRKLAADWGEHYGPVTS